MIGRKLSGAAALGILFAVAGLAPVQQATSRTEARESVRSGQKVPAQAALALTVEQAARRAVWTNLKRTSAGGYRKRDGWTVREGQRRARKAANVRRNRAAHKR